MEQPLRPVDRAQGAGVSLVGVAKRYETARSSVLAVDGISFECAPGTSLAVMGPSGSGKSTLLHLIGAMDDPDEGTIRVGEYDVGRLPRKEKPSYRRRIGFVFQRFHLLPALTALDNVAAPLLPIRTDFDKHARARTLLAAVGLESRIAALPSELSGGEQQRVAIARALVNDPILLLADEPTGNLDSKTGADVIELLADLRKRHGMTVIVATHDPVVACRCDRIIRIRDGRIVDEMNISHDVDLDAVLERINRLDAVG